MTWLRALHRPCRPLRRRAIRGSLAALLLSAVSGAQRPAGSPKAETALERFDLRRPTARHALPHGLREISGLAVTPDGRVFTHNDEHAVVSEIEPCTGRVVKSFALGTPPLRADLEGIAVAGDRMFMVTSTGILLQFKEGANGATVPFTSIDTGFGRACELEGLAFEPADRSLLFGCKEPRQAVRHPPVLLWRWSVDRNAPANPDRVTIVRAPLVEAIGSKSFRTASLERDPRTGHYLMVAGPERVLAEVTTAGEVLATAKLRPDVHRRPEGLTLLGDSVLVIADEGGNGRGTIACYRSTTLKKR